MIPRHEWFKERIKEIIKSLQEANKEKDWNEFRRIAKELAVELHYATTEWDRYYRDLNE